MKVIGNVEVFGLVGVNEETWRELMRFSIGGTGHWVILLWKCLVGGL